MRRLFRLIIICILCLLAGSFSYAEYLRATGKDEMVLVSVEKEIAMGRSIARGAEEQYGLYPDPELQQRVNDIGQKLAKVSDRPALIYSFKVLHGEELEKDARINAFAAPGGYIFIFKEMVDFVETDEALAAILAHEIAHICAKDGVMKLQSSLGTLGLQILAIAGQTDRRTYVKSQVAIAQLMMQYSREAETRADERSVEYLRRAGYNPEVAITFMEKMLEKKMSDPIRRYHYFRSHPYVSERIATLKKAVYGTIDFDDYMNQQVDTGY